MPKNKRIRTNMRLSRTWISTALVFCTGCLLAGGLELSKDQLEARYRAKVEQTADGILLKSDTAEWDAGLRINPPKGQKFDFSGAEYLAVDVENLSKDRQMRLTMHITSGGKDKASTSHVDLPHREVNTGVGLNPGEKRTMRLYLPHAALFTAPEGGRNIKRPLDTSKINSIEFKISGRSSRIRSRGWSTAVSRTSGSKARRRPIKRSPAWGTNTSRSSTSTDSTSTANGPKRSIPMRI